MSTERWYLLKSGPGNHAVNMACDEALLQAMPRLGRPVLRFYSWTEPGASFGYFQRYVDVEQLTGLRPLVRRPTGGGVVPHDADWTYTLSFPAGHWWHRLRAPQSYLRLHEWLQAAFASLKIETELAPAAIEAGPGQCFVGYAQSDLLWQGRKIAGAAQRRTRGGLLIQGSVQPPPGVRREQWEEALCKTGETSQGAAWEPFAIDGPLQASIQELAAARYSSAAYNRKR